MLEEGDMITYDIRSEGNLKPSIMKTDEYARDDGYMGNSGFTGNRQSQAKDYLTIVPSSLAIMRGNLLKILKGQLK